MSLLRLTGDLTIGVLDMLVYSAKGNPTIRGKGGEVEAILENSVENHMGCWLWTGTVNYGGYGLISVNSRRTRVHRMSYEVFNGEIPKGLLVRHLCHEKLCCNPDHLELGTDRDNWLDMLVDGHTRLLEQDGSDNHMAKLTEEQVYQIRRKYKTGLFSSKELAEEFGVSRKTVENAVRGVAYSCYTKVAPFEWRDLEVDVFRGRVTKQGEGVIGHKITQGLTLDEIVDSTQFTKYMVEKVIRGRKGK